MSFRHSRTDPWRSDQDGAQAARHLSIDHPLASRTSAFLPREQVPSDWMKVFKLMLKQFKGRTTLEALMSYKKGFFRGFSEARATSWLQESKRFLIFEKSGQVKAVSINWKESRLCFKYKKHNTDKCQNVACPYFHICRGFVAGSCTRGPDCHFNHSFHTHSNASVCHRAGLQGFTDEEICMIAFRSTPVVCTGFSTGACRGEDCPDIHVCINYMKNLCHNRYCHLGHAIKGTQHNEWVLDTFHMMGIHECTLQQMVIVPCISTLEECLYMQTPPAGVDPVGKGARPKEPQNMSASLAQSSSRDRLITYGISTMPGPQTSSSSADGLQRGIGNLRVSQAVGDTASTSGSLSSLRLKTVKDSTDVQGETAQKELSESHYTHLCELHTWKGVCSRGYRCPRYHDPGRRPYLWQLLVNEQWRDFAQTDNIDIEEEYCELAPSGKFEVVLVGVGGVRLTLDFKAMKGRTADSRGHVHDLQMRRWSTPSYVEADPGADLSLYTQWCWYIKDVEGDIKWKPAANAEVQYTLEEKHTQGQHNFYIEKNETCLVASLQDMVFKTLDGRNCTSFLRRPYFSLVDKGASVPQMCSFLLKKSPSVPFSTLPDHWSSVAHCQDFEMVELTPYSPEYLQVESRFHSTLSRLDICIKKIFRVQNPSLWDKFCSTKRAMTPRDKTNEEVDERKLFHGTPTWQAARGICANNIDFRRAGDNVGAKYGKGAYFSTTARYSHSYTAGPEHCMFMARVLVGMFTKGEPSYKTPPVREGLKLFDSCVNDVDNPTIFVIFDLAQSYPEYLIQYEKVEEGPVVGGAGYHLSRPVTASQAAAAASTQHRLHPVQPAVAAPHTSTSSQRQPVSAVQTPVPAPRTPVQKSQGVGLASRDPLQTSDLVNLAADNELQQASKKTPSRPSAASSQAQYSSTARVGHADPVSPDRGAAGASAYSPHAATARDSMPSRHAGYEKKSGESWCVIS